MPLALDLGRDAFPYASHRMPVLAPRGVVATSEPLAAQAGLEMLRVGGNAVDAALATAIALTVVEPCSNGIGSDAFALVWDGAKLHGLNGSGRAPQPDSLDLLTSQGHTAVPAAGWLPGTVPGAPGAWRDLHARFGRIAFETLFEPAIYYAEHGFPVGPVTAAVWALTEQIYRQSRTGPEFRGWFETFAPGGKVPAAGETFSSPGHAAALRAIATSKAESFYAGNLAEAIARFASETGGYLTREELAAHTSTWVEPIGTHYRGYDVWEIPPNGQGIAALIGLNLLEGFDLGPREQDQAYHLQLECMKLAFADAHRYVADMEHATVPVRGLLSKEYATQRRRLVGETAGQPAPGQPEHSGTVYLCAADSDGMMVSYIQSNYQGFGSGVVVPGLGIALQNRGAGFRLKADHPNVVAPGKRPYHTIIPAFMTEGNAAVGPFGVMGGHFQPQGHVQMVVNQVDFGLNPQAALDAPRWQWLAGLDVELEWAVPDAVETGLRARGHQVRRVSGLTSGPKGQIIRRLAGGGYVAGSEPRADGCAVGY